MVLISATENWTRWFSIKTENQPTLVPEVDSLMNLIQDFQCRATYWALVEMFSPLSLNLSMNEGSSLFCFVVMRSIELGCFRLCSWYLWKSLNKEGCMGLVPWHLELGCKKFLEYWMISSLKIKLDRSWKLRRIWNVTLVLLERSWWAGLMKFIW